MFKFIKNLFSRKQNAISGVGYTETYGVYEDIVMSKLVFSEQDDGRPDAKMSIKHKQLEVKLTCVQFYLNAHMGPQHMKVVLFSYMPTHEDIKCFLIKRKTTDECGEEYKITIEENTARVVGIYDHDLEMSKLSRGLKDHTDFIEEPVSIPVHINEFMEKVRSFCKEHNLSEYHVLIRLSEIFTFRAGV